MFVEYSVCTRKGNQDAFASDHMLACLKGKVLLRGVEWIMEHGSVGEPGLVFCLSDGVPSGEAGFLASEAVVDQMAAMLEELWSGEVDDTMAAKDRLHEGMRRGHELLLQLSEIRNDNVQLTASFAGLLFCRERVFYANVGNARVYRYADESLQLLTEDHTEVWELVKAGKISVDKAETYPGSRNLVHLLGGKGKQRPIFGVESQKLELGDIYLVCSDGFSHGIALGTVESMIAGAIGEKGRVDFGVVKALMDKAFEASGHDDCSVALFQVFPERSRWTRMIQALDEEGCPI